MERERTRLREKMNAAEKNMAKKTPAKVKKAVDPKALRVGDSVKVLSLNLKGTVSTLPDAKGNLFVQMGILRSQVNLRDIEPIDEPVITAPNFNRTGSEMCIRDRIYADTVSAFSTPVTKSCKFGSP